MEYEVDLLQGSEQRNLDVDSYISLPTGERIREVTINPVNSPIRGRVYPDQAGRYSFVIENRPSLMMETEKTVIIKSRMYLPC